MLNKLIVIFLVIILGATFVYFRYEKYFTKPMPPKDWEYMFISNDPLKDGVITQSEAIKIVKNEYPQTQNIDEDVPQLGSTSNIQTKHLNDLWKLQFFSGSGDCPAGCIDGHYWYFTVDNKKQVTKIGEYKRTFDSKTNSYIELGSPIWDFLD